MMLSALTFYRIMFMNQINNIINSDKVLRVPFKGLLYDWASGTMLFYLSKEV